MINLPDRVSVFPSAIRSFLIQRVPFQKIAAISFQELGKQVRIIHRISNFDLLSISRAAKTNEDLNNSFKFSNFGAVFGRRQVVRIDENPFNTQFVYTYDIEVFDGSSGRNKWVGYRIDSEFLLTKSEFNAIATEQISRLEENADKYQLFRTLKDINITGIYSQ